MRLTSTRISSLMVPVNSPDNQVSTSRRLHGFITSVTSSLVRVGAATGVTMKWKRSQIGSLAQLDTKAQATFLRKYRRACKPG